MSADTDMGPVEQLVLDAESFCRRIQASISATLLKQEASAVQRKLWASQPAEVRLAAVWLVLAAENYDHIGLVVAAMFLVAGVHGMPALHVKDYPPDPAAFMTQFGTTYGHKDWKSKINILTKILPRSYGHDIAKKLYGEALATARNPALADQAIMEAFDTLWKGDGQHIKPESYDSAIKYVKIAIRHKIFDNLQKHKKDVSIDDEERGPELIAPGVGNEAYFQKILDELHKSPELRKQLNAIPKSRGDAVKFLELMAEGYDEHEIIGDYREGLPSMLPHIDQSSPATGMTYQNWNYHVKPMIYEVAKKHFQKLYERQASV